jgi:hypothetical protein
MSVARGLAGMALLMGLTSIANAVTLRHDDLVGLDSITGAVVRVDGVTGTREIISDLVPASDFAIDHGGTAIYTVEGDSLYELDPSTGLYRTVASGFNDADSVAVGSDGSVFVVDRLDFGASGSLARPRVHQVDPLTGTSAVRFVSGLELDTSGDPLPWTALDIEMVGDSLLVVLAEGDVSGGNPFGYHGGGMVGFDLSSDTESILLTEEEFGIERWDSIHGLGVLPSGELVASNDFNLGGVALAYDPATGQSRRVDARFDLVLDEAGEIINALYLIDVASTSDGRTFVSGTGLGFDERAALPEEQGVFLLAEIACGACPSGVQLQPQLVGGSAFSPGSTLREIQAVVIPEPSTGLLLGLGLAGLASRRRLQPAKPTQSSPPAKTAPVTRNTTKQ